MRRLIGVLLLILGVGALAWWAWADHAVQIEDRIRTDVLAVISGSSLGLSAQTSGRDVTVAGRVVDEAELDRLTQDLTSVEGIRMLDTSAVETLPVADPFEMTLALTDTGWRAEGVVPAGSFLTVLQTATAEPLSDLTFAAGAPSGWDGAALWGVAVVQDMGEGAFTLSDRSLTVTGLVDRPADRLALLENGAALNGFTIENDIETRDDGRPFRLRLMFANGEVSASGKVPEGWSDDLFEARFDQVGRIGLDASVLGPPFESWIAAATTGADALSQLEEGAFVLGDRRVTLMGEGTPDGNAAAEALMATMPDGLEVVTELTIIGADRPFEMSMDWDGNTATASGTYPADFAPRGPLGTTPVDGGEVMFLPDEVGAFTTNADAGVAALGLLQSGSLMVSEGAITLTGTARSPQVGEAIDVVLGNVAPQTVIERNLTFLDDGSPAAWILTYQASEGAAVEGRLPVGLGADDLAELLGLPRIGSNAVTALEDEDAGSSRDVLALAATYLPEIETLTFSRDGGGSTLDLIVSPGVDITLLAQDLAERVPNNVAFSVSPVDPLPPQGAARTNAATGLTEVFVGGFWIPDLNFSTTIEGCAEQSNAHLADGAIAFLSGSAQLDATSLRAINGLAAVAVPCVEADLEIEVAGHTDASGDAEQNQILSQQRAEAVRAALIDRGVPARAITAIGFGDSDPIATNDTPEGRAINRRTEIEWFERGALRDP